MALKGIGVARSVQAYLSEEMMIKRELEALMALLGPVETARFLGLPRQRYGNYVGGIGSGRLAWIRNALSTKSSPPPQA